jgi:microcystin degradation protein MlrC
MRVGIIMLYHESNTFISEPVTLDSFRRDVLLVGEPIRDAFSTSHHELGGFFTGLDDTGIEAVPLLAARIIPGGIVTAKTYHQLLEAMLAELDKTGPLDGLLVAPHGSSVSEQHSDMDGHWLATLRQRVGPDVPIISTLDPHANLSQQMVASCDAIVAYRSNPHLDQKQRGLEAASLMVGTLQGNLRPTQAAVFPPVAINMECQLTSEPPCKPMYKRANQLLQRPGVLSTSIILGFPYADVEEMGSAFIVVTDNDADLARQCADELGDYLWNHKETFDPKLTDIDSALDNALSQEGPICLLDMGDNIGAGTPGNGTLIARAIVDRKFSGKAFVCLADPLSVKKATAAEVNGKVTLQVGGSNESVYRPPLEIHGVVRSLHDGKFKEPEVRHSGFTQYDMGRTAVVDAENGLTVMLTSIPVMPFSLRQLTCCGLDPKMFQLIVAKGVHAPTAAYGPVCKKMIRVNTAGVSTVNMRTLPFKKRRRPLFPFEQDFVWPHD